MGRPRRILLTGTGGTGRRTIAELLASERGLPACEPGARPGVAAKERELHEALLSSGASKADIVIAWTEGCPPPRARDDLRSVGFEWFWLDGDRGAGRPPADDVRFVDPFVPDGSFWPIASVVAGCSLPRR